MVCRLALVIALLWPTPPDALCVSAVSYGTGADVSAGLALTAVPLRAGWQLWSTVDTRAVVDTGDEFTLGPQRPYTIQGHETYARARGDGPYLLHLCAPGDVPPGTGWYVYLTVSA